MALRYVLFSLALLLAVSAAVLSAKGGAFGIGGIWWFCVAAPAAMSLVVPVFRGLGDREFRRGARRGPGPVLRNVETCSGLVAAGSSLPLLAWSSWGFALGSEGYLDQWLAWLAAALLMLLGFGLMDRRVSELHGRLQRRITVRVGWGEVAQWSALGFIVVFATVVRVVDLDTLPGGWDRDEKIYLQRALDMGGSSSPVLPYDDGANAPSIFSLMVYLTSEVFGVSMVAARLVAAALGVGGVFAVFLLGRRIMGPPLGLLAAAVLASLAWDINLSRTGWEVIATPLCAALAAWALLRALSTCRLFDFALAGTLAASGLWFYSAYYCFPIVLGAMLAYGALRARPEMRRRLAAGALAMGMMGVVCAAPLLAYALTETEKFTGRVRLVSVFDERRRERSVQTLPASIGAHLMSFHFAGDDGHKHNVPGKPMLDPVAGALALLGLALAAVRWRRVGLVALPLWILVMMLPGVLSDSDLGTLARRSIGVLPAVALLTALPLALCWRAVAQRPAFWRLAARGLVIAAVAVVAHLGVGQYFGEQKEHPQVYADFDRDKTLLAYNLKEGLEQGYAVAVTAGWDKDSGDWGQLLTVWPQPTVIEIPHSIPIDPRAIGDRAGMAVYVDRRDDLVADALARFYPNAEVYRVRGPDDGRVLFYRALIGRDELWQATGLAGDGGVVLSDTGSLMFQEPGVYRGALHVRRDGPYEFTVRDGPGVVVDVVGRRLSAPANNRMRLDLRAGLHEMSVSLPENVTPGAALLWKGPGRDDFRPIGVPHLYHGLIAP